MLTLSIANEQCPAELRDGLAAIMAERADRFADGGVPVTFAPSGATGFAIAAADGGARVTYARKIDAFRALGRLLGVDALGDVAEATDFTMAGIMIDVSRNGVLTPEAARAYLRACALLGINMVMLYAEDTYEVPGEPFFGYLRGRYTYNELKGLDDYADALGIEMIPCIQALAHLEQILQWPAYADYQDTWNILLAEDAKTYALVEKMIDAASAPFRSKRIHVGMDEAQGLATGRYREKFGEKNPFDVLNDHLLKVREICDARGLRPMIWSDMFFRLASSTEDYYDTNTTIPEEVIAKIPKGVDLVYWDYYHLDASFYAQSIDRHRALQSEPLVAGGVWTWNRLWAALPYAYAVTDACMAACKAKGIRETLTTLWGDDGMECDVFSALPAIARFAAHVYQPTVDEETLAVQFRGATGTEIAGWLTAAKVDYFAFLHDGRKGPDNVSKWLLWQDPLLALMDPQFDGVDVRPYFTELAEELTALAAGPGLNSRLAFPAYLAATLALKCNLRRELAAAYTANDRARLRAILDGDLASLRTVMDGLWRCHRDLWLATYKPFGLEVLEGRYGAQRTRLESLAERLAAYLDGAVAEIPELAVTLEKIYHAPLANVSPSRTRVETPSVIK